jgi:glucose/arabinose dehydrogenase
MEMKSFLVALGLVSAPLAPAQTAYLLEDLLTASGNADTRSTTWKPGAGIPMEISGMDWLPDGRLAVAIRKGEIWLLKGVLDGNPAAITSTRFASGLHEPLGLLWDKDSLLTTQRTEMTRLRDTDGDGIADEYLKAGSGWNVSGAYHGYAYGPKRDGKGNLWVSLNVDMGERSDNQAPWRGWAGIVKDGQFHPMVAGLRSPCGLGTDRDGEMFCVDQQGTWIPTTPIYHLTRGAFFLNPEGIASQSLPNSPLKLSREVPTKVPYPEAARLLPEMKPPAVWLPYNKMGRSGTDLCTIPPGHAFGPFEGQMLVAEFTDAKISRVFLEKIGGEYQGACFPFLKGFASGIVRLQFAPDGSLMVGMTSRGWSSLGTKAYGLQRVKWNGIPLFSIKEMRATPEGFDLVFTSPVDRASAGRLDSYSLSSYTYLYSGAYGSPEIDPQPLTLTRATVSADGLRVSLTVEGRRKGYVHELHAEGVLSPSGAPLEPSAAYYTLNRIPSP